MPENKWAIMVYLAGDNNLEEEMVFAIKEMCRIGAPAGVDIFVQFDRGGPPIRFATDIFSGDEDEDLVLESLKGSVAYNSSDPSWKNLKKFLDHCIENTDSANRYMLILSGHGSGAIGDFMGGDGEGSGLTITSLAMAIEKAANDNRVKIDEKKGAGCKFIDILGMDSCLMNMVETAYAVHGQVDYMVAAEGFEVNTGWPYARLLEKFKQTLAQNDDDLLLPEKMAERIVKHYCEYYESYTLADVSTDMALLDLNTAKITTLTESMNNLSQEMRSGLAQPDIRDAIEWAHWKAQTYKNDQYVDIVDFCQLLKGRANQLASAIDPVVNAINPAVNDMPQENGLVLKSCATGAAFQYSYGLSIFFPWADLTDVEGVSEIKVYRDLSWAMHGYWDDFIEAYVKKTQRLPKGCDSLEDLNTDQAKEPKDRTFRESRLNRKFGKYRGADGTSRFWPPYSKYWPPYSKGGGGKSSGISDTKNPPIFYPKLARSS